MSKTHWLCQTCLHRFRASSRSTSLQLLRAASTSSTTDGTTLPPSFLAKARARTLEHEQLSQKIASSYDSTLAKRIGELTPIASALIQYETARTALSELQTLLRDPNTDAELRSLAAEDVDAATTQVTTASLTLTSSLAPRHPFADLPCLLEIRPGVGGSEAALFAGDLLRMYQAYCARTGLRATLMKYEATDGVSDPNGSDAPLQEAVLEITAPGAYDVLRCEAGVHRVQRVPATESKGRTHTSTATVMVLPSIDDGATEGDGEHNFDDPSSDYYVNPADVRTDIMRARGAGGQHVNTTDSAVRLTHLPTGTVVAIQDMRSQHKNREKAWRILRARIAQARRDAREEETLRIRRAAGGGSGTLGRADKIRTYNWLQQRVSDHRSGMTVQGSLDEVLGGGEKLESIMESVRAWILEHEIENLLDEDLSQRNKQPG